MEHNRVTLASDETEELILERCDCGQYSLTIGSVTMQLAEETVQALTRMLGDTVTVDEPTDPAVNLPVPSDVQ